MADFLGFVIAILFIVVHQLLVCTSPAKNNTPSQISTNFSFATEHGQLSCVTIDFTFLDQAKEQFDDVRIERINIGQLQQSVLATFSDQSSWPPALAQYRLGPDETFCPMISATFLLSSGESGR